MSPLDALWHVLNLLAPALGVSLISASLAKLLWRRELAGVAWRRLASRAFIASALASLAALFLLGRDGKMLGYGALVLACTVALWWLGFRPGRR